MKNDGSHSWIVIRKGMNTYVDELPEENVKSIHNGEVVIGTERAVAAKHKEQSTPQLHHYLHSLNGGCADRSTEVERHSCRRPRR